MCSLYHFHRHVDILCYINDLDRDGINRNHLLHTLEIHPLPLHQRIYNFPTLLVIHRYVNSHYGGRQSEFFVTVENQRVLEAFLKIPFLLNQNGKTGWVSSQRTRTVQTETQTVNQSEILGVVTDQDQLYAL